MKYLFFFLIIGFISCGDSYNEKMIKYNELLREAEIGLENEEYDLVIEKSQAAYKVFDSLSLPLLYKGIAYNKKGEYKKAIKFADKAIKIDAEKSYGYRLKAEAYYGLNKKGKAIKEAFHHNKYFENDFFNVDLIASLYFEEEDFEKAIPFLSRLIDNEFKIKESLLNRAISYNKIGETKKSISDYEKLRELYGESFDISDMNYLLGELNFKNQDFRNAIEYLTQSEESKRFKILGYAYENLKNRDSAIFYFNEHLTHVDRKDPEILERKYQLEKAESSKEKSDKDYFEYKEAVWERIPVLFKIIMYLVAIMCFMLLSVNICKNHLVNNFFDGYTVKEGVKFSLTLFPFGGAFLYFKNRYIIYSVSVIYGGLIVLLIKPFYLHFTSFEYLLKAIRFDSILIGVIGILGLIILLDLVTLPFRVSFENVKCRRNLNLEIIKNRLSDINVIGKESKDIKEELDYFSNQFNAS